MNQQTGIRVHQSDPLDDAERLAWLRLSRTENVGPITFFNFIDYYGSASKTLEVLPELIASGARKKPLKIPSVASVEKEMAALQKMGGCFVTVQDPDYPVLLAANEDAPPILAVLGDPSWLNRPALGIVGARNASLNGRKLAERLARDLGGHGQVIASGLARGIDTAAHEGALESGTVAVLAGGADVIYPQENAELYKRICESGAVLAENALGVPPRARDFPRRNRIVSGMSQGVIVIEATMRSGSMITARLAGEQGREVYAVPGSPMDPRAEGPNHLIREGAQLIRNADDVMESLRDFSGTGLRDVPLVPLNPPPKMDLMIGDDNQCDVAEMTDIVLQHLSYSPVEINELCRVSGINIAHLPSVLIELELAGDVQRLPGGRVVRL